MSEFALQHIIKSTTNTGAEEDGKNICDIISRINMDYLLKTTWLVLSKRGKINFYSYLCGLYSSTHTSDLSKQRKMNQIALVPMVIRSETYFIKQNNGTNTHKMTII
eukprot:464082_1